ncbi:MAG: hypothetical protein ABIL58_06240 [Pseudomonadota bacterium]
MKVIVDDDYIRGAEFHNSCRKQGIQGPHTDFLICACAHRLGASIYTKDQDFQEFSTILPISLFQAGGENGRF